MIGGTRAAVVLALLAVAGCDRPPEGASESLERPPPATAAAVTSAHPGLLYGRVTMEDGTVHEGRLRWGGDEEALWNHSFNGFKSENPWVDHLPRPSVDVFGFAIPLLRSTAGLGRPLMARFGDVTRIEARGRELRVVLKSGAVFELDRFAADDLADGVRVWDVGGGVVDLGEWKIRTVEFLPTPPTVAGPAPLYGTVRSRGGVFTGLVQWDREAAMVTDELRGHTADGAVGLAFGDLRSIAWHSAESALVTLVDGREIVVSGTRGTGPGNRGVYVDDARYGRVLVPWHAFERVDFTPTDGVPAYGDYAPGAPLTGHVTTRDGRRLGGRIVFDLDESQTTETLDASAEGVDYMLPFGRIASIVPVEEEDRVPRRARVTLDGGETLLLEPDGDLAATNGGLLVFADGAEGTDYVAWADVELIRFDPSSMVPDPAAAR